MHKHFKKITAGLMAAAMIVPITAAATEPMSAFAYEVLGESTFEHKLLPWITVECKPARQVFDITEGAAHIRIINATGGERSQWDLQFRHRGLDFKKGHEYKVSFKVKSNHDGMELVSHINDIRGQNQYFVLDGKENAMVMGPHMDGNWGSPVILSTEYTEYSGTFIPTEDVQNAEWVFYYAYDTNGYGGNAQDGDELWFDDMSIEDMTDTTSPPPELTYGYTTRSNSGLENNYISVNQLGYYPGLAKIATLGDNKGDIVFGAESIDLDGSYEYEIVDESNDKVVFTGTTDKPMKDSDSGDTVCRIDFSKFDTPGRYYIRIKGKEWRSFPFFIGNDIYSNTQNDLLTNALNFFYQNRSGVNIDARYITSGEQNQLAHKAAHNKDVGYAQSIWRDDYAERAEATKTYSSSKVDVSGGWYKPEDHSKNMTEGGISVWTLQNMYEHAIHTREGADKFADGSGVVVIPESGNDAPDILDECRYELDFMAKMKVQPDDKTWGEECAGMYYHKVTDLQWQSIANRLDYECEDEVRLVKPPTFAATLNYAACAAQGARLWAEYDAEYAAELLKSAKEAYEAYKQNWYEASAIEEANEKSLYSHERKLFHNLSDCDYDVSDDAYWAACELFVTASIFEDKDAESYFKELSEYEKAFNISSRNSGGMNGYYGESFTLFNIGNTSAAGSFSLILNMEWLPDEEREKLNDSIIETADEYVKTEEDQGYGIPYLYDGPNYYEPTGLAYEVYTAGFEYGSNERAVNNMIAMAYAYDLTGEVKYLNGVSRGMDYLLGNNPMSYSFITGCGSYFVQNPTQEYWQYEFDKSAPKAPDGVLVSGPNGELADPYIYALGFGDFKIGDPSARIYADSSESWSTNNPSLSGNASLAWVVSFMQDAPKPESVEIVETGTKGDINSDGELNISDVLLLQKWLLAAPDAKLTNWKAADLCKDDTIDVFDLIQLKKALLSANKD